MPIPQKHKWLDRTILTSTVLMSLFIAPRANDIDDVAELPQKALGECDPLPVFIGKPRDLLTGKMGYLSTPSSPQKEWWTGNQILWRSSCPGMMNQCFTRALRKADRYADLDSMKIPLLISSIRFRFLGEACDSLSDSALNVIKPESMVFSNAAIPIGAKIRNNTSIVISREFFVVDSSSSLSNFSIIIGGARYDASDEGLIYPFRMASTGWHSFVVEYSINNEQKAVAKFLAEVLP